MTIFQKFNGPKVEHKIIANEIFIPLSPGEAATVSELSGLNGFEFVLLGEGVRIDKVLAAESQLYQNVDGDYIMLTIEASMSYLEQEDGYDNQFDNQFDLWIPRDSNEPIEMGNFKVMDDSAYVPVDEDRLSDILDRLIG